MMLGLGDYESSSEDEATKEPFEELKSSQLEASQTTDNKATYPPSTQPKIRETVLDEDPSGPVLGPMHDETETLQALTEQLTTSRSLIHGLTLPPVPNLNVPPSPPGSPDLSVNAKFTHFLSLKRQDVHFNEKLAGSISLKNPSLLKKMMQHAGIDEQSQYSSTLPSDIWNVPTLPTWGYKEELLKGQKDFSAKVEERLKGPRDTVEFVPEPNPFSLSSQTFTQPE